MTNAFKPVERGASPGTRVRSGRLGDSSSRRFSAREATASSTKRATRVSDVMLRSRPSSPVRRATSTWVDSSAKLDHPRIVPVFDSGCDEEKGCWIAFQFVPGMTLSLYVIDDRARP